MCFNVFDTFCFAPLGHLDARGRYFSPLPWSKRSNNLLEQRVWAVPRVADEVLEGDNVLRMFHVSKARLACQPVPRRILQIRRRILRQNCLSVIISPLPKYFTLGFYFLEWSHLWDVQTNSALRLGEAGIEDLAETTQRPALRPRHAWKNGTNQHMVFAKLSVEHAHICKVKNASATQRLASWCFWRSVSQGQWGQCVHARVPDVTCPFTKS